MAKRTLFQSREPTGMDHPVGTQLGHSPLCLHCLQSYHGQEHCKVIPPLFWHVPLSLTDAMILGAGLSLSYLSEFPGPRQRDL